MNILTSILVKFISVDSISSFMAKLIAKLLNYASKKGGNAWDTSKKIISKVRVWIDLFDQVYEDDEMTEEEEEIVSKAIRNEVDLDSVVKILKKVS